MLTNNTISNTRLVGLIVIMSFIALTYVLKPEVGTASIQTDLSAEPLINTSINRNDTLDDKNPVTGTVKRIYIQRHAPVLSI